MIGNRGGGQFPENGVTGNYDLPQSELADNVTLEEVCRLRIICLPWLQLHNEDFSLFYLGGSFVLPVASGADGNGDG